MFWLRWRPWCLGRARSCDRAPYRKAGPNGGRRPFPLAVMLRIYCLQQWYNLSDPGAEEVLYDICSMRAFAGLELGHDAIPDETTILNFRHLLERHELTKAVFAAVSELLEARGALLRGGTIVDATLIAASPSTKNEAQKRDPEMRSSRRQPVVLWHEGTHQRRAKSGSTHAANITGINNIAKIRDPGCEARILAGERVNGAEIIRARF